MWENLNILIKSKNNNKTYLGNSKNKILNH